MLDVVFILLIFFIVTASFVKEAGFGLNRPEQHSQVADSLPPIVVEISSTNVIRIQSVEVSRAAVKSAIIRLKAESPLAAVVVRLDPAANTETMVAAVDGIRAAKVSYPSVSLVKG
jgi:biopolymer transport protein ExbD